MPEHVIVIQHKFTDTAGSSAVVRYSLILLHTLFLSNAVIYCFKQGILPIQPSLLMVIMNLLTIMAVGRQIWIKDAYYNVLKHLFRPYLLFAFFYILCFLIGHVYMGEGVAEVFLPVLTLFTVFSIIVQYSARLINRSDISAIIWLSFFLLALTAAIDFFHPGTFSKLETRAAGLGENPNSTGFRIIVLLFFITYTTRNKFWLTIAIAVTVAIVALTLSRGAILLLVVFIVMKFLKRRQDKKFKSVMIRLLIVGAIALLLINPQSIFRKITNQTTLNRITMIMHSDETIESDSRVSLVKAYFDMALDKPVWGHSLLKSKDTTVFDLGPHNTYVLVFYETGIIGLALLLGFLINNFSFYLRHHYYPGVIYWMLISCEFFFSHNIIYEYFFSFSMAYLVIYFMNDSYVKR